MSETNRKGKVIVLVAPSGAGKSTIADRLLHDFDRIRLSISATTRPPRRGEKDGREYLFMDDEGFDSLIEKKGFLEWEKYGGNRYGTLHSEVDKLLETGYFPLFDIDVRGALNIKQMYGDDCLSIFIEPPSMDELKKRLLDRKTETEETLAARLETASYEMRYAGRFDYRVVNDDLEKAYGDVKEIITRFIR